jgi:hypothetical protein
VNVRLWHDAEERACSINVRFSPESGHREVARRVGEVPILLQMYFGLRRAQHCFVGDLQIGRKIQNAVRRGAKIALTTHSADFCNTIGSEPDVAQCPCSRGAGLEKRVRVDYPCCAIMLPTPFARLANPDKVPAAVNTGTEC